MNATQEKITLSRIRAGLAWLTPPLFLLAALIALASGLVGPSSASAKTPGVPQNRVWGNSAGMLQSRPIKTPQSLELQRENSIGQYDSAVGDTLAVESTAASSTLASFSSKVGQATDGVLGGFVKADGTVDFVPFTRNGLTGHTAAQAAGAIPADAAGGFSVTVQDGKIVGYNFQSALNANSPNYMLPPALQQQIKTALSAATTGH